MKSDSWPYMGEYHEYYSILLLGAFDIPQKLCNLNYVDVTYNSAYPSSLFLR